MPKRQRTLTIEEIELQRDALFRQLHKISDKIDDLWRLKKRLLKKADRDVAQRLEQRPLTPKVGGSNPPVPASDLDIPVYLRRAPVHAGDEAAIAEITAQMEERQKSKARGRIAKMKAKQSGELGKMPLQGKAALAAIREAP